MYETILEHRRVIVLTAAAVIATIAAVLIYRRQLSVIRAEALEEATDGILSGAAAAASAPDVGLAVDRDPGARDGAGLSPNVPLPELSK